jgi:gas vesicle protein
MRPKCIKTAVAAAAAGVGAALLFAPKSGRELRAHIAGYIDHSGHRFSRFLIKAAARGAMQMVRAKVRNQALGFLSFFARNKAPET